MSDERIALSLRSLGLTDYELRVYLAILRHPGSRIPEIARKSKVPQPKVYATVKRLLERGLCESELGPVNTYTALRPRIGLAPLLDDLRTAAAHADDIVSQLDGEFEAPTGSIAAREGRIKVYQGAQANRHNFIDLVSHAEQTIELMTKLPLILKDDDEVMADALRRGVQVRILGEAPADFDWAADEMYKRQVALGVQARHTLEIPMRLGIFDSQVTIMPMVGPAGGATGLQVLEVRNKSLSAGMLSIFQSYWDLAAPIPV